MIRLALAQPGTAVLSFDLCCAAPVLPVATGRQCSPPRRLLPRQAINAPRQRTASVQIPIASDTQLRHTSRGFLLWRFAYAGPTCPPRHLHGGRHPQTFTKADIDRGFHMRTVVLSDELRDQFRHNSSAYGQANCDITSRKPQGLPMRTLLVLITSIISISAWAGALDDARTLGAPMQSVERAIQLSRGKEFSRKDVLAVFDISQPSGNRRFFYIHLKNDRTSAHYAAHGRSNGNNLRATKFRGFLQRS